MAKFAEVTYGTHGDTELYTYVVNDNVRTGQLIQTSVKHAKSGKIFATTAEIQSTTVKAAKAGVTNIDGEVSIDGKQVATAVTGKEAGIERTRQSGGKFAADKSTHDSDGNYVVGKYDERTRGANIKARQQESGGEVSPTAKAQKAVESYDSYMSKYD